MTTWILILTLVAPSTGGGSSIHSVPGFTSFEACANAGNAWLKALPDTWSKGRALCVNQ